MKENIQTTAGRLCSCSRSFSSIYFASYAQARARWNCRYFLYNDATYACQDVNAKQKKTRTQKYCKYFFPSPIFHDRYQRSLFSPSPSSSLNVCCRVDVERERKAKLLAENWLASIYFILSVDIDNMWKWKNLDSDENKSNVGGMGGWNEFSEIN